MTPYEIAKTFEGTYEWREGSNPKVVAFYADAGHPEVVDDDVAWCAAFVGAMIKRAGGIPTGSLLAQSYLNWGVPVDKKDIKEGDILIFKRGTKAWQGHVTFAAGKPNSKGQINCLGGNQKDMVNVTTYTLNDSFLGARRAPEPKKVSGTLAGAAVVVAAAAGTTLTAEGPDFSSYALTGLSVALVAFGLFLLYKLLRKGK